VSDALAELISRERLAARVAELAEQINADYRGREQDLLLVGVLKGCFLFMADLLRHLEFSPAIDFMRLASYGPDTETSGVVEIRKDVEIPVAGRDVLIVEDIIDTGLTLDYLRRHLMAGSPKSVRICTLLDKPARRKVSLVADYVGFTIGDDFVVGYGLDYHERHRGRPSICVLNPDSDE
jgi:hypoxanthine phosphoribosyltransferase